METHNEWRRTISNRRNGTRDASFDYAAFARHLTRWFAGAQRDLPWRRPENARDAYRVLVSEVMLQQTTVAAVAPFYERFLARFPTLQNLAEASIEDVLPLWAGLGYYQRARLLHAAARAVMERHGGEFPREASAALALPGIGRYTAGAVTSIAFDQPSPIVDANAARVFSRVFLIAGDLKTPAHQKVLWTHAQNVVATGANAGCPPSVVNPALMELGALVCVPRTPRCEACPVAEFCAARHLGRQNELPHLTPKRAPVELHDACAFLCRQTAPDGASDGESAKTHQLVLLRQRPHEARVWWRGMWELPRVTRLANESGPDALRRLLRDELALPPDAVRIEPCLKTVRHGVTHHQITLDCWKAEIGEDAAPQNARWFGWDEIETLAVPSSMRRLLAWLRAHPAGQQPSLW